MSWRNLVDDSLLLRLARELGRSHRHPELRGLLAREGNDLRKLLGAELRRDTAAIVVAENVQDERLQIVVVDILLLGAGEHAHDLGPPLSPSPHALSVDAERRCLLDAQLAIGGPEHNLRALNESLFRRRLAAQPLKDGALALRDDDDRRVLRHQGCVIQRADERKWISGSPPSILGAGLGVGGRERSDRDLGRGALAIHEIRWVVAGFSWIEQDGDP